MLSFKQLCSSHHAHCLHGPTGVVVVFPSTPLVVSISFILLLLTHFGVCPSE